MSQLHELIELLWSAWVSELVTMILNYDYVVYSTTGTGYVTVLTSHFYCKSV